MTISQKILALMEEKNIKQKQLADYTGISTSAISDWKKKGTNPSVDKIGLIADCLGVSIDYLLGRTDQPNGYNNNESSFNNSGSNNNQNIGNGNIITTNTPDNKQTDIYSDLIEHLEALSKSEKLRAVADMTDLLEEKYPVKKKNG